MQVDNTREPGSALYAWRHFLGRSTLWLALLLLGSGVVCWVAANWPGLDTTARFTLTQALLALTVLLGIWLALRLRATPARRQQAAGAVLTLAGGLLGALLALLGQTYQTGADTWQLFAWWAVLLLPWALAASSQALWLLWCLVLNVALGLWVGEHLFTWWGYHVDVLFPALVMALANLALLGVWEAVARMTHACTRVGPRVLALLALAALVVPLVIGDIVFRGAGGMLMLAWLALTLGLGLFYQVVRRDLLILAMLAAGVICVSLRVVGQWLLELEPGVWAALPLALLLMAEAVWAARWLRGLAGASGQAPRARLAGNQALAEPATATVEASPATEAASMTTAPWYVQGLLGLSAWLATVLLLVFLGFSGLVQSQQAALVLGLVLCAAAIAVLRGSTRPFWHQCGVALGFAGQLLALFGIANDASVLGTSLAVVALAGIVYVLASDWLLRFLSGGMFAFGMVGLLSQVLVPASGDMLDIWFRHDRMTAAFLWQPVAVLGAWAVAGIFAAAQGFPRREALLQPLAWALLIAVQGMVWMASGLEVGQLPDLWRLHPLGALLHLAGAVLPAVVAFALLWSQRQALTRAMVWVTPLALLALALFWLPSPGIAFALAWLLLGFGLNKPRLAIFGIVTGLAYLLLYYYQLEVPLLQKAFWLVAAAAVLFLLRGLVWLVPRLAHTAAASPGPRAPASAAVRWRMAGVLGGLVLVLAVCNTTIYQREQVLAHGEVVILELAPVDPRSLMQGDYMALHFAAADFVAEQRNSHDDERAGDGYVVLVRDANGVAHGVRLQHDLTAADGAEQMLRYRVRPDGVRLVTNAYFFPEGQADHYARARYGEVRLDGKGTGLLVRMLDENRQPL